MGNFFSGLCPRCDNHPSKEASGACLTHKKFICMSCISEREHLAIECRIIDLNDIDVGVFRCLCFKQTITMEWNAEQMETKIKEKIEEAYEEALDYIETLRVSSYEITMEQFENIKARKNEKINHLCEQLDKAIECFDSSNKREGKTLIKNFKRENMFSEFYLERENVVLEGQEESFVKMKEINERYESSEDIGSSDNEDSSDNENEDGSDNENEDSSDNENEDGSVKDHEDERVKGDKGERDKGQEDGSDEAMGNAPRNRNSLQR